jgi:predicted CoA-substrate-specific enzyme activase
MTEKIYLGIDVGSVSTNIVAVDENFRLISKQYMRTNGQPVETVKLGIKKLQQELNGQYEVCGVGTTGSGRQLTGIMIGADVIKNEITAHATATVHHVPEVRTIFEIGGQDSKIIFLNNGLITDFAMNTVCAAGTGSFLDHQAERLGIPIQEFGECALKAKRKVRIAGRCTVFAESDMVAKQQFGFSKEEIINGLCEALVRNYLNNLGRGKKIEPPYVFQGGVAANAGIRAAFEKELGEKVYIPEYFDVMGSLGVAILAKEYLQSTGKPTSFRGFETADIDFTPSSFECTGCSNLCEVIKVEVNGEVVAMLGDKCGRWTNNVRNM